MLTARAFAILSCRLRIDPAVRGVTVAQKRATYTVRNTKIQARGASGLQNRNYGTTLKNSCCLRVTFLFLTKKKSLVPKRAFLLSQRMSAGQNVNASHESTSRHHRPVERLLLS